MYHKTPEYSIKKRYAVLSLKWCQEHLGFNKKKKTSLKLIIRIKPIKEGKYEVFGHYDTNNNRIYIYGLSKLTVEDIVSTVIHEYTHYLQSNKKYWEYFKTHYYSTHPYERQAKRNELKYTNRCINSIKTLIQ